MYFNVPLTEAVRVQLYSIANSPNARPECIVPKTLLSFDTFMFPSVVKMAFLIYVGFITEFRL